MGWGRLSLARMSRWALVSSAVRRKVSARPAKMPRVSRLNSSVILFQVPAVPAMRDQVQGEPTQDDVGARIRSSLQW